MNIRIRNIINFIFSKPFFYDYLRAILAFGTRLRPIKELLDLQTDDSLIDVGCGTGYFSRLVKKGSYIGIDINKNCIEKAKRKYERQNIKFMVMNALGMKFQGKIFDKVIYISMLHHLNDHDNLKVLNELSRITKDRIVIQDLAFSRYHFLNNLLIKCDRGEYPRSIDKQIELIEKALTIKKIRFFFARSGVAKYSLMLCEPK